MKKTPKDMVALKVLVPAKFVRLCEEYYKVEPEQLTRCLVNEFTVTPPTGLTIVSHAV